ncbi:MAG TPA: ABC transporter ATP-binding protein [Halanaerobiales bacterium]|nr:ABC transporter ATP-binding protein [Halanaerobiales bacterium]HPZ63324.1 ABC transporter ATP-binding protein [Halanaerobiales bacterium]HQD04828.1 ABC transporter ATP-binding protein [Halanaerobiales bacterium]
MRGPKPGPMKLRPDNPGKTLLRLFSYFKFNKFLFIAGLLAIIISSIAQIAANAMLSPIIDSLIQGRGRAIFIRYILIMVVMVIIISLAQYLGSLFMAKLSQKTVHKIREEMFSHMEKLPVSFFDRHPHGKLMSTFTNDVDMLNQALEQSASQVTISVVTVVGTFAMMLYLSPILTLVVVGMLIFMLLAVKYVGQRSAKNFRYQQAALADMNGYIEEMMSGQKVVKVFNYEERAIDKFRKKNEELRKASTLASTYGVMLMPIMGSLSFVLYALVSMLGALLVIKNRMSVGNIAAYLQYTRTISRPITQVSNQFNILFAALAGAERIFNLMDEEIEADEGDVSLVKDSEGNFYWRVPGEDGQAEMVPVKGYITFEDVNFGYTLEKQVLKKINLYAKPGQKIAFALPVPERPPLPT